MLELISASTEIFNFLFASLPSCKYGTYNQEKKACVINMSCPSGQTLSLGKCIVDPINIKDEYTFSSNNDNCSTYKDIKDKLLQLFLKM